MVLFQASIVSKAKFLLNNTVAIALIEESDFKKIQVQTMNIQKVSLKP